MNKDLRLTGHRQRSAGNCQQSDDTPHLLLYADETTRRKDSSITPQNLCTSVLSSFSRRWQQIWLNQTVYDNEAGMTSVVFPMQQSTSFAFTSEYSRLLSTSTEQFRRALMFPLSETNHDIFLFRTEIPDETETRSNDGVRVVTGIARKLRPHKLAIRAPVTVMAAENIR